MAIFVTWRFINFSLQAEKAKQLLYQAKYGRFGLGDPFHAMQRDSDSQKDNSFDEAAVKAMYDNQLMQLENLIATQRKAQQRMREQLAAVEKRYHKVKKRSIIYVQILQDSYVIFWNYSKTWGRSLIIRTLLYTRLAKIKLCIWASFS